MPHANYLKNPKSSRETVKAAYAAKQLEPSGVDLTKVSMDEYRYIRSMDTLTNKFLERRYVQLNQPSVANRQIAYRTLRSQGVTDIEALTDNRLLNGEMTYADWKAERIANQIAEQSLEANPEVSALRAENELLERVLNQP